MFSVIKEPAVLPDLVIEIPGFLSFLLLTFYQTKDTSIPSQDSSQDSSLDSS